MIVLADAVQLVPFWSDVAFKGALVGLVLALTGWVVMLKKGQKAQRAEAEEDAAVPGLSRSARKELETVKGEVKDLKGDVKALGDGLDALNEKADDLANGIERASDRIQDIDDKVNDAATEVAKLSTDMEWVKDSLLAIKAKLGVV
jgi:X-X-X-Leu-X-X-Gly heptad repeat protein